MRPFSSLVDCLVTSVSKVLIVHCQAIKFGIVDDTYIANNILTGYARCRELRVAAKLFDEIPHRDSVSWNSMIAGQVNFGNFESAWGFLNMMKRYGLRLDGYTFGSILKGVASNGCLFGGQQVHADILKMGYEGNVYAESALLDMYAKCGRVQDAHIVFQLMPERDSVSWNALIAGYAELGDYESCFLLFRCMDRKDVSLDDGSFVPVMSVLDDPKFYKVTLQLHAKIIKYGFSCDTTVCNAAITAYSECGSIEDATRLFDDAADTRDLITWNSMLAAHVEHSQGTAAFKLFLEMQEFKYKPDIYTFTSLISACYEKANLYHGKSLHALVMKNGFEELTPISNSLIAMYLKSNSSHTEDATKIFEPMHTKDLVSWNSILTGFSQSGLSEKTLMLFQQMRLEQDIDHYTFSAVLRSCADMATLQLGQQVHVLAVKFGFELNEYVASSLIFMYSKCGIIEYAKKSFEDTYQKSSITWNSIIFGYAQHGQGKLALDLFFLMRERNVQPDHITFVAVLSACSHIGMVEKGYEFLKSMEAEFGIPPRMEHYACAIDLLGRARRLEEAKELIREMPFEPDVMVWKTLLGACRICGDIELATQVANHLLVLEPEEHCTYVLLSNMYGHLNKWDEIAGVKKLMRDKGVKKVPGWSWIEVKNEVHAFNADDHSHMHCHQIYQTLRDLMEEIRGLENSVTLDILTEDLVMSTDIMT